MFKKILAAIDFSESSRNALDYAGYLAGRMGADVTAVHVVSYLEDIVQTSALDLTSQEWRDAVEKRLQSFLPQSLDVPVAYKALYGASVPQQLAKFARNEGFDLIVTGTHGRSGFKRMLMGSVTHALCHGAPVPLLIVPASCNPPSSTSPRILVPIDFSELSEQLVTFSARLSSYLNCELHLVHVLNLNVLEEFHDMYGFLTYKIPDTPEAEIDVRLQRMLEAHRVRNGQVKTLFGQPAREILAYAQDNEPQFLVMGTHNRRTLERWVAGSVSSAVMSRSPVPVIMLSPLLDVKVSPMKLVSQAEVLT